MDDTEGPMAQRSRGFGKALRKRFRLPLQFADERLSSFEAEARGANRRDSHAIAAQIIAETWIGQIEPH